LEDLGINGRIILEWILREMGWEVMDWMHLVENRDQCWVLVKMVMNLWVP